MNIILQYYQAGDWTLLPATAATSALVRFLILRLSDFVSINTFVSVNAFFLFVIIFMLYNLYEFLKKWAYKALERKGSQINCRFLVWFYEAFVRNNYFYIFLKVNLSAHYPRADFYKREYN